MSESVKIGGIRKNPAIDRINSLNAIDIKNQAVKKMEQLLLKSDVSQNEKYTKPVPIDFSKADWKGESKEKKTIREENSHGNKRGRNYMEGIKLSTGADLYHAPTRMAKTVERNTDKEISIQYKTTGNIRGLAGRSDDHLQYAKQAVTGKAGIPGNPGNTAGHQPYLSREH